MTKDEIQRAFKHLDELLGNQGQTLSVDIAGGAAIALEFDGRESTEDVDATRVVGCPPSEWQPLVAHVGNDLGLPSDWLNTRAGGFAMGTSSGAVVYAGLHLTVRSVSSIQLLAMKISALRDEVDYADARLILRRCEGDRETLWRAVEPFLVPGNESWRRQNFEALWEDVHGPD